MTWSCRFKKLYACKSCRLKSVPSSTNSRLVFLALYLTLSHRIAPVLVTNSLEVTFQTLYKLIACLLVSVCVMVVFLCLERLMYYQPVLLCLLWETLFLLLGRDTVIVWKWSLKGKLCNKEFWFFIPYLDILNLAPSENFILITDIREETSKFTVIPNGLKSMTAWPICFPINLQS